MPHKTTKNTLYTPERIILGVDPGTNIMGFGIIKIEGKKMELSEMGVFHLGKLENQQQKLKVIFEKTLDIIEKHQPDEMAVEAPFFGKNVQSMLKLGRAQGVVFAAALYRNIPVVEYSPRKVKQSITGSGNASKEQVAGMMKNLLALKETPAHFDSTDALAVAVCHFFQRNDNDSKKNYSGWNGFLKANPHRKK